MNRRVLINLGFFSVVFVVMIVWALNNIVTLDAVERPYTISGEFAQASGVRTNAEVTYLGVHYGRVSKVERRTGGVRITMKIDRGKDLPEGAIASIFRKSAIGEPYIDFTPPPDAEEPTGTIHSGDVIPQERTRVPLEFSELLRSASRLVGSIDPQAAGSLIHELALGLDGRGEDLRDLTTGFDRITAVFAARTDELDRLAENNTKLIRVLADHRLSIGRSITNLRAVSEALRSSKGDLERLLRDGPAFLRTTADLVAEQKRNLDCLLTDLTPVLQLASQPEKIAGLATLLEQGPQGFGYVFSAIDREPDGPWIRVNLAIPVGGTDPKIYDPRPSLPVVPTISPCASTMTPASIFPASAEAAAADDGSLDAAAGARAASPPVDFAPRTAAEVLGRPADRLPAGPPLAAVVALVALAGSAARIALHRSRHG